MDGDGQTSSTPTHQTATEGKTTYRKARKAKKAPISTPTVSSCEDESSDDEDDGNTIEWDPSSPTPTAGPSHSKRTRAPSSSYVPPREKKTKYTDDYDYDNETGSG